MSLSRVVGGYRGGSDRTNDVLVPRLAGCVLVGAGCGLLGVDERDGSGRDGSDSGSGC